MPAAFASKPRSLKGGYSHETRCENHRESMRDLESENAALRAKCKKLKRDMRQLTLVHRLIKYEWLSLHKGWSTAWGKVREAQKDGRQEHSTLTKVELAQAYAFEKARADGFERRNKQLEQQRRELESNSVSALGEHGK